MKKIRLFGKINNFEKLTQTEVIVFLIFINFLLKFIFLFIEVLPSDVEFYASTGRIIINGVLPYQDFTILNYNYDINLNTAHPNGPLNYLIYGGLVYFFGQSTFIIKLPMFIAENFISVYLYKIGCQLGSNKKSFLISMVYTLCMVNYLPGILLGTDELVTGAFALMGLYYFIKNKFLLSGLFISLGISYKFYPIFYILPMFIFCLKNKMMKEFMEMCFVIVLTYIIVSFPYLILCPKDFFIWTLGQSNRFITISYGKFIYDSFFYSEIYRIDLINLIISPHLILEILLVGLYFIKDLSKLKDKSSIYEYSDMIKGISYYIAILPVISLSYNYRYFQWLLPIILLLKMPKINLNSRDNNNYSGDIVRTFNRYIRYLLYSMIFNFICTLLIVIINQMHIFSQDHYTFFSILSYNDYLLTFFYCYILSFAITLALFKSEKFMQALSLLFLLNGITGVLIYYMHELTPASIDYADPHYDPSLFYDIRIKSVLSFGIAMGYNLIYILRHNNKIAGKKK